MSTRRLAKVQLFGTAKAAVLDLDATNGAVVGKNLFWPDGTLVKRSQILGGSSTGGAALGTTDDLDEGQFHVYFTDRRAQDAVGAILASSATIDLGYVGGTSITATLKDLADTGTGGALLKITRDSKGRIAGTSAATTDDLAEGAGNLYFTDARADARIAAQKAAAGGLATLDAGGKLDASQLPALAISETFVVNTEAAMLALSAQQGDVAVRTDLSKSYILAGTDPTVLANWQELLAPSGGVASFNGRTGSVTPASGDYTAAQVGAEPTVAGGTAAQFWQGDKTWQDFATAVRAAVLTGLSTATNAVIAATDTVLGALGKLQAQITDNLLPKGYIDGFRLAWVSPTAITVTSGSAYIQGSGKVLRSTSDIAFTGLSLTGSTAYHFYAYDNAGTPAVEMVTTAPATPYSGAARSKTGDTSRRYLGTLLTAGSGNLLPFVHTGNDILYPAAGTFSPYRVLANGTATSPTTVDISGSVPAAASAAHLRVFNQNNVNISLIATGFGTPSSSVYSMRVNAGLIFGAPLPLGTTKSFDYALDSAGSGGLYVDVVGFRIER